MLKKKGFTLVELLVAATIVGALLVFATVQYRNSAAEARWNHAKVYTKYLANAILQARMDYANIDFDGAMSNSAPSTACTYNQSTTLVLPGTLIACGYLENSEWQDDYFVYYACKKNNPNSNCQSGALACVKVASGAKMPSSYQNYQYCVFENAEQEYAS